MVKLDYKSGQPIHRQITKGIKDLVISGVLKTDEQLPSVRELSVSLTVNPNTVQRAYRDLETEGVIYSIRGKGNFVAKLPEADPGRITELYEGISAKIQELLFWGEEKEAVLKAVGNILKGEKSHD